MAAELVSMKKLRMKTQTRPKIAPWARVTLLDLKLNDSAMSKKMPKQTTQISKATGGIMAEAKRV